MRRMRTRQRTSRQTPNSEGEILGETDGCVAAFEELPTYGVLNWGEDSFDESLCP